MLHWLESVSISGDERESCKRRLKRCSRSWTFCTSKQTKNDRRMTGGGPQELILKIAGYQASGTLLGASDCFT